MSMMSAREVVRNPADDSAKIVRAAAAQLLGSIYATLDDVRDAFRALRDA